MVDDCHDCVDYLVIHGANQHVEELIVVLMILFVIALIVTGD